MRFWRSVIGLILVAGLAASSLATCIASADDSPQAQMACCRGGHKMCGPNGTPADCCKTALRVNAPLTTPLKLVSVDRPLTASTIPPISATVALNFGSPVGVPAGSPSPPASSRRSHLALSVLRV